MLRALSILGICATKNPASIRGVFEFKKFLIAVLQRVAEGNTISRHAGTAELKIVVDKVIMGFGSDENGVGHIKANSASHVDQEVIAALKVGTTHKVTGEKWLVETEAFQTNSPLQFRLSPLAEWRAIDRIEIVKNGAIRIEKDINVLVAAPCHLATYSEIFFDEKKITAERRITTASDALWSVVLYVVEGVRRRLS